MGDARTYSFASGQSPLPNEVLEAIRADLDPPLKGGLALAEFPFTSDEARTILSKTDNVLRKLLNVPDGYEVLFLQGGAYAQFGLIAMNFGGGGRGGAYVQSGHWSRRAANEARSWITVHSAAEGNGTELPLPQTWDVSANAAYCHYTSNESAEGLQFPELPADVDAPLIADMTADLLMRPLDVGAHGLIYASSQKNLGIAGLTVVIISRDLLGSCTGPVPSPFDYRCLARERSKVNTPPLFAIAVAGRVCEWLLARGGLLGAQARSREKAGLLYRQIESDGFYTSPVAPRFRSNVSVRFHLPSRELETDFLADARAAGLLYLQGHPDIGGMRASLYNFVPLEAAKALAHFMGEFRRRRG